MALFKRTDSFSKPNIIIFLRKFLLVIFFAIKIFYYLCICSLAVKTAYCNSGNTIFYHPNVIFVAISLSCFSYSFSFIFNNKSISSFKYHHCLHGEYTHTPPHTPVSTHSIVIKILVTAHFIGDHL